MKKRGILNAELAKCIAGLGHTDLFLIGDAGMPVPEGVPIIDLVLTAGIPTFAQVLAAVADEAVIQAAYLAEETETKNPATMQVIRDTLGDIPLTAMSHEDLKRFTGACKFAIRTGENTPYSNIVCEAGVAF